MSSSPPPPSGASSPQRSGATRDRASKRKRTLTNGAGRAASRRRTVDFSPEPSATELDDDDDPQSDEYDPDQPIEERREIQRGLRKLREDQKLNRDKYLQPGDGNIRRIIRAANALSGNVKQTTEATIDSRLLVETVELSYKKTSLLTSGDAGQGVDVASFVTQCLRYMRMGAGIDDDNAAELTSTQRQRRHTNGPRRGESDDDEIGDEGDPCNWEHLGRFACLPHLRRPPTAGFLLGPLSVEKKVRKITKRTARFRPNNLTETRPEVLEAKDIQRKEENDLTAICKKILDGLVDWHEKAQDVAERAFEESEEAGYHAMEKYGLRKTSGIDYFRFVINPLSFGQTIENMFYVSFLIRDNKLKLEMDEDGFPTLAPVDGGDVNPDETGAGGPRHGSRRQQAIFHLDPVQWRAIVDAFNIDKSIIPHRQEQADSGLSVRGWYT